MQETIVQGVRNASTNNDNSATSTKRNSTVMPTQQLKGRKYGAGNKVELLGHPLWDGLVKLGAIFLTVYEVIYDSIAENVMKLFNESSKVVLIFSLLTEKITSISKSNTKQQITKDHNLSPDQLREGARTGIYIHDDTSYAGKHVRILEYIQGTLFNVSPFQVHSIRNVSLANGIVAVDKEDG